MQRHAYRVSRREFLAAATVAPMALQPVRTGRRMFVCVNEASSQNIEFRAAMEGYAKAGVRAVDHARGSSNGSRGGAEG